MTIWWVPTLLISFEMSCYYFISYTSSDLLEWFLERSWVEKDSKVLAFLKRKKANTD